MSVGVYKSEGVKGWKIQRIKSKKLKDSNA